MSSKNWAVIGGLVLLLVWAVGSYAGASAEARLLRVERDAALDSVAVAHEQRARIAAVSDSLIALQAELVAHADSVREARRIAADAATADLDVALADAMVMADSVPAVRAALFTIASALQMERTARVELEATTAAALFESRQRNRSLENQLLAERDASTVEIMRLNDALALSVRESDAWQRAAAPGVLRQVWQQGRVAILVGGAILLITR